MAKDSSSADSLKTISVAGFSEGVKTMRIETETTEFVIGDDSSPLEYFLGSLGACINVIGNLVAVNRGFELHDMDVQIDGDIDTAKLRGKATDPRAGFQEIRIKVRADADADTNELAAWMDEVSERCPVINNVQHETPTKVRLENR